MSRLLMLITGLGFMAACGSQSDSKLSGLTDNNSVSIRAVIEGGRKNYFVEITESNKVKRGYRSDCGSNLNTLSKAFGYNPLVGDFLDVIHEGSDEYEELHFDEQPSLSCTDSAKKPKSLFAVYNPKDPGDPSYYVKFPDRPHELYALGCQNLIEFFGLSAQNAIPISSESVSHLIPQKDPTPKEEDPRQSRIRELRCYSGDNRIIPLPTVSSQLNNHTLGRPKGRDVTAYKVENTGVWPSISAGVVPYIISSGLGFAVDCGSNSQSLFTALGLKQGLADLQELPADMWEPSLPGSQPILRCKAPTGKNLIKNVYKVVNDSSQSTYVRFQDHDRSLVRLGCGRLTQFFGADAIAPIQVTAESLPHLAFPIQDQGKRLVDLSCQSVNSELVAEVFNAVFGVSAQSTDEFIIGEAEKIHQRGISDNRHAIVEYFVEGQARSDYEIGVITQRAFHTVFGRNPQGSEWDVLKNWIARRETNYGKTLRPHYQEVVAHLRTVHLLPSDVVHRTCQEAYGRDCNIHDWGAWNAQFLTRSNYRYEPRELVDAHVRYGTDHDHALREITNNAFRRAYGRDANDTDFDNVRRLVREQHAVRAHCAELTEYLKRNLAWSEFQRINQATVPLYNNCGKTVDMTVFAYTDQERWQHLTTRLRAGETFRFTTRNKWFYWHYTYDRTSLASDSPVLINHMGRSVNSRKGWVSNWSMCNG